MNMYSTQHNIILYMYVRFVFIRSALIGSNFRNFCQNIPDLFSAIFPAFP